MEQAVTVGTERRRKLDSLQATRALAFLGIFTSHCETKNNFGAWGASIFLILSGFVMLYTYENRELDSSLKGCLKFSVNKIKKLYPLHIITMLLAIGLTIEPSIINASVNEKITCVVDIVLNLTLLQSWEPYRFFSLNSVAWYLSVCPFLYAMFPLLIKKLRKISSKKAIVLSVLIYLVQILISSITTYVCTYYGIEVNLPKWTAYIFPPFRLGDFVIGCCMAIVYLNYQSDIKRWLFTFWEVCVFAMTVAAQYLYINAIGPGGLEGFRHSLLYTPLSALFVLLFALNGGGLSKILTCKPLIYLGDMSVYAFLIHGMVIRYTDLIYYKMFRGAVGVKKMLVIASIGTITFAIIYKWIEGKLRNRIH